MRQEAGEERGGRSQPSSPAPQRNLGYQYIYPKYPSIPVSQDTTGHGVPCTADGGPWRKGSGHWSQLLREARS